MYKMQVCLKPSCTCNGRLKVNCETTLDDKRDPKGLWFRRRTFLNLGSRPVCINCAPAHMCSRSARPDTNSISHGFNCFSRSVPGGIKTGKCPCHTTGSVTLEARVPAFSKDSTSLPDPTAWWSPQGGPADMAGVTFEENHMCGTPGPCLQKESPNVDHMGFAGIMNHDVTHSDSQPTLDLVLALQSFCFGSGCVCGVQCCRNHVAKSKPII